MNSKLNWRLAISLGVALVLGGLRAETPDAYVDYVESDGRQWIDVGVVGRYDTKIETSFEWMSLQEDVSLIGCRRADADNPSRIMFVHSAWGTVAYGYGVFRRLSAMDSTTSKWYERQWELHRQYAVVAEYKKTGDAQTTLTTTVDGFVELFGSQTSETGVTNGLVNAGNNLYLFAYNQDGTAMGCAKARCYGLKVWQDGQLKRDLKPCVKGGRAGLYDEVSKVILYSASGTDLIACPDTNDPDYFVEYVESSGGAYVDLGVKGNSGVRMEAKMMWVEVPGDGSFVASRKGSNARFYLYHHYNGNTFGYGNYFSSGKYAEAGVVYEVNATLRNGSQSLAVGDNPVFSRTDKGEITTDFNLYLFACNKDGVANYSTKARCYSLKLWTVAADGSEELVRDFVPCLKNGAGALYDRVSERIFKGQGTTALKASPLVVAGKPDYFVEHLDSWGNTYLDTGVRARSGTRVQGEFCPTQARELALERFAFMEDPMGRVERTYLGACDKDGKSRFYMIHQTGNNLWMGYGDLRVYPERPVTNTVDVVTTNYEGDVMVVTTNRQMKVSWVRDWIPANKPHLVDVTLEVGRQSVTYEGDTLLVTNCADTVDAGGNLYLFACNQGGKPNFRSNTRCYWLKLWQTDANGEYQLVRDFRPCMKDGRAGLYDAVKDEILFTPFLADASCIGDPIYDEGAKPVKVLEYVESDGTQWIDLGVVGRADTVAEFDMEWKYLRDDPDIGFLGSRGTDGTTDNHTRFYMWHNAHNYMSCGYGPFVYVGNNPTKAGERINDHRSLELGRKYHVRSAFYANRQIITVDGQAVLDLNIEAIAKVPTVNTGRNMYLFAYNNQGRVDCASAVRLYGLKLWQDGKLVRNLVPVMLDCGLPALYDKVSKTAFHPAEGKAFSALGPEIGDWKEVVPFYLFLR